MSTCDDCLNFKPRPPKKEPEEPFTVYLSASGGWWVQYVPKGMLILKASSASGARAGRNRLNELWIEQHNHLK